LDKILIFAVLKQRLLQRREAEGIFRIIFAVLLRKIITIVYAVAE